MRKLMRQSLKFRVHTLLGRHRRCAATACGAGRRCTHARGCLIGGRVRHRHCILVGDAGATAGTTAGTTIDRAAIGAAFGASARRVGVCNSGHRRRLIFSRSSHCTHAAKTSPRTRLGMRAASHSMGHTCAQTCAAAPLSRARANAYPHSLNWGSGPAGGGGVPRKGGPPQRRRRLHLEPLLRPPARHRQSTRALELVPQATGSCSPDGVEPPRPSGRGAPAAHHGAGALSCFAPQRDRHHRLGHTLARQSCPAPRSGRTLSWLAPLILCNLHDLC